MKIRGKARVKVTAIVLLIKIAVFSVTKYCIAENALNDVSKGLVTYPVGLAFHNFARIRL